MELNFESNNNYLVKYRSYMLKEINGVKYVVPDFNTPIDFSEPEDIRYSDLLIHEPLKDIGNVIMDLINIGQNILLKGLKENETAIVDFVNKYGLLGFINDTPLSDTYLLDQEVILKRGHYINAKQTIQLKDYLRLFFPLLKDEELEKKIKACKNIYEADYTKHDTTQRINEELYYSEDYCEEIASIGMYAMYIFSVFCAARGIAFAKTKEEKESCYDIIQSFSVTNLNFDLSDTYESRDVKIRWEMSSLKQMIDTFFALMISSDINTIKMCKHCKNVFLGKNPKAEYCSAKCRNQANVYKSRAKNKEQ